MAWTLQFSDAFTDSDGTFLDAHNPAWVMDYESMTIAGNRIAAGNFARSHITTSMANDQAVELAMHSDSNFHGPLCRYAATGAGQDDFQAYCAFWNSGNLYLYKRYGGSFTQLGSTVSQALVAGDVLRVEAVGSQISLFANGVLKIGPIADGDIASGAAAIRGINATIGDGFAAYDDAAGIALDDFDWQVQHPQPDRSPTKVVSY